MPLYSFKSTQQRYRLLFWLLITAVTVWRLLLADRFGLGQDESHYVLYARHLAWGYFDHPPMVAFLAYITTLLGDGVFFVRLGPIICASLSLIILRYLSLALYNDERIAFWSAFLLQLMPYQHVLMVALLPDAPLNVFWCGVLFCVWRAIQSGNWFWWISTGFLFGGTLLSKYHGVLLALCLMGYFITSARHRFWLKKPQPWTAASLGLLVFLPNILWNARRDWLSYAFQLGQGSGKGVSLGKFLQAVGAQFGVWSPVILGLLITAAILLWRQKTVKDEDRFLLWTSIPVFIFFCLTGFTSKILPHWTAVGWWSGSILLAMVLLQKTSPSNVSAQRWRRWTAVAGVTGLAMTAMVYTILFWPLTASVYAWTRNVSINLNQQFPAISPLKPFEPSDDITNDLYGWPELAKKIERLRAEMPHPEKTFVFSHRFFTISQLAVYLSPDTEYTDLHRKFNQYRLWFSAEKHTGWDALFVVDQKYRGKYAKRYRPLFTAMNPDPVLIQAYRDGQLAHQLAVYRFWGFNGRYEK